MSMFTKRYNEAEMLFMLNKLLLEPDEYIETAIYCMFKGTGILETGDSFTGYAAVTSKNRFIGYRMGMFIANDKIFWRLLFADPHAARFSVRMCEAL